MRKSTLNFIVDLVAFLLLLGMIFTGVLIKYVLVPCETLAAAEASADPVVPGLAGGGPSTVFGWGRHDWGALHFWFSVAFGAAMAFHLFLHWRWLWGVIARGRGAQRRVARGIAALAVGLLLAFAAAGVPFLLPTESVPPAPFEASALGLRSETMPDQAR